ncbi:MAG TPA: alpha-hydroxy acid oxidase, partial [Streptosporangiaceae bacterium]|nr:alpha-hydroxy acid oxidase [Streptosporangiaceae bacterium]
MDLLSIADFAESARSSLPADVWDFFQGGSGDETALAANRAAFSGLTVRPRVLVDVSAPDLTTGFLGLSLEFPIAIAPIAYQRLAHPDGELATAAAAGEAGTLFVASFFASQTLEDIARAATGPLWLQVYWLRQREEVAAVAARAHAAGYRALVLTVDAPRIARRLRDLRNGFTVPPEVRAVNLDPEVMAAAYVRTPGESSIEQHSRQQFDAAITWDDLAWLRDLWPGPLVVKGIMRAEECARLIELGVDGIVVSNHGGRQLDGVSATIEALPEVAAAA